MSFDYITPNLAISSLTEAEDETEVLKRKFTTVVNVCEYVPKYITVNSVSERLPSFGRPEPEDLQRVASRVNELIDSGEKVLIHCLEGIDRSPTVVMVALMQKGLTVQEAKRKIQAHRPQADPHPNWLQPLSPQEKAELNYYFGGRIYRSPQHEDDIYDPFYADELFALPPESLTSHERTFLIEELEFMDKSGELEQADQELLHQLREVDAKAQDVRELQKEVKTRAQLFREEKELERLEDMSMEQLRRLKRLVREEEFELGGR